jgi:hypothetical protein
MADGRFHTSSLNKQKPLFIHATIEWNDNSQINTLQGAHGRAQACLPILAMIIFND